MKCQYFPFFAAVFLLTLTWGLTSSHAGDETVLDTATIELKRLSFSLNMRIRFLVRELTLLLGLLNAVLSMGQGVGPLL